MRRLPIGMVVCRAKVRPRTETELRAALNGATLPLTDLLTALLVPLLFEGANDSDTADWIPHDRSPLGGRRTRELAARGAFPGARKVGRKWLVPRMALDEYIERTGHGAPANEDAEGTSTDVADLASEMGYALTPLQRKRGEL